MPERHHHHHHHHWSDDRRREGYAWRAGEPGPSPNLYHLRRNLARGKIAGVCAGLADYFGWNLKVLRIGWIFAAIFAFPMAITAYILAAIFIKPTRSDAPLYASPDEDRFWRTFSARPTQGVSALKHRFRAIDARIAEMERAVTSNEYALRQEFRDLERGA